MRLLPCLYLITGGAIGTLFRYVIAQAVQRNAQTLFPWGTLCVNLTGSFAIGALWALLEPFHSSHPLRLFLIIGLLGGFTTFSSFSMECLMLFKSGAVKNALLYILTSNIGGIALAFVGYWLVGIARSFTN